MCRILRFKFSLNPKPLTPEGKTVNSFNISEISAGNLWLKVPVQGVSKNLGFLFKSHPCFFGNCERDDLAETKGDALHLKDR